MIKVGSDFSGVGAFEQVLMRMGVDHDTVFACEIDKYARQTFIANYGEPTYYPTDVYDREIPKEPLDMYMTSPPCQSFSLAGKRGGQNDKRGILFYNSHEFIKKNKPRFFIFENVKGLLSDDNGKTFRIWLDYLGGKSVNGNPVIFPHDYSLPYHIYHKVLNAKDYGVPQNRERIFIIGIRDDSDNNFHFPKPVHLEKRLKDVLEDNTDSKYDLSDKMIKGFLAHKGRHEEKGTGFKWKPKTKEDTANALRANAALCPTDNSIKVGFINQDTQASTVFSDKGTSPNICAGTHGYAMGYVGSQVPQKYFLSKKAIDGIKNSTFQSTIDRVQDKDGACATLLARDYKDPKCVEVPTPKIVQKSPDFRKDGSIREFIEVSPTLRANMGDNHPMVQTDDVAIIHNVYGGFNEEQPRLFEDYSPTIRTAKGGGHIPSVIRKVGKVNDSQSGAVYDPDGLAVAITGCGGGQGAKTGLYKMDDIEIHGGSQKNAAKMKGISPCLTNAMGEGGGHVPRMALPKAEVKQINKSKESNSQQPYQQNRVFDEGGISPAVLANLGGERTHNVKTSKKFTNKQLKKLKDVKVDENVAGCVTEAVGRGGSSDEYISMIKKNEILTHSIRRLTPRECFRLMDFPDSFVMPCSDTQMYKQAGNSIVVAVLYEIINRLKL